MAPRTMRFVNIADLLGVDCQQVQQLAVQEGFPEPVGLTGRDRLWDAKDLRAWAKDYLGGKKRWGARSSLSTRIERKSSWRFGSLGEPVRVGSPERLHP